MIDINQIPDFVWEALQEPALRQSEEFLKWLDEDEKHGEWFVGLCDCREAAWRASPENIPDVGSQWERVKRRNGGLGKKKVARARFLRMGAVGAAASLAIVFLLGFYFHDKGKDCEELPAVIEGCVADSPADGHVLVAIKAVEKVTPVLLYTGKEAPASVYEKVLDYTRDTVKTAAKRLTLATPRGKSIKVVLSDSTAVWLNADSRLSYPSFFAEGTRTVELEGEAYFKVAQDKARPFIVKHHETMTQALGTEFNIRSYPGGRKHVTLVEGSVMVSDTLSSRQQLLVPGQDMEYDSLSNVVIKEVNLREFTAWTEDLFYFEQTKLLDIMQILGRWYNVTVVFRDEEAESYHFTFWAERTGTLEEAVEQLNQIGAVKVSIDAAKKQVVIKKR